MPIPTPAHPIYIGVLQELDRIHAELASLVNPPQWTQLSDHGVFRYTERTPRQAIVLKLARNVTGLRAARILCLAGLFQEQSALNRMLDEIQDDVTFLSHGLISG